MSHDVGTSGAETFDVRIDGDYVVVSGPGIASDRKARLFFASMLGGERVEGGWRVPTHSGSIDDLTVRINRWLRRSGRTSNLVGLADETVQRDETRRRSFSRTAQAARELRNGLSQVTAEDVDRALREIGWNFTERTLRPHQMEAVIHGLTAANPANFSVPGAGKTASTLALAAVHMRNQHIDNVVVVGPLSCFRPWEEETRAALPSVPTRRIRGTAQQRRNRLRELAVGEIALISYASAASDYRQLIELCKQRQVLIVADESHRIKRFNGGTWAQAIMEVAAFARVRVILSGTPMPQSGRDLYTQLNVMWPGGELTGPKPRFASAVDSRFPTVLSEILPFVSRTPKSALGLRPPVIERVTVPFDDDESAIYRLVMQNFRRRVQSAGPAESAQLDTLRRGRPIRLLQAASNPALLRSHISSSVETVAIDDNSPTLMNRLRRLDPAVTTPSKFVAALELIRRYPGEKVVVWSAFVANLDSFSDYLRRESGLEVYQVDGRVQAGDNDDDPAVGEEPETREQVIGRFLDAPGSAILVTNPASCSESISLHKSCRIAIYLDRTYDCAQWLQSIDRIHRLGLDPAVEVRIYVLQSDADGMATADALVEQSLSRKETVMRELLEGAALSPFQKTEDPMFEAEGDDDDLRTLLAYLLGETR